MADARERHRPGPVEAAIADRVEEGRRTRMRILVTNDDGVEAPGPARPGRGALADAGHEVVVAAPDR